MPSSIYNKKTTTEFIKHCGIKTAKKHGVLIDGILYSKSRLLEEQTIRKLGELEDLDLKSFTGIGFRVPLIMKDTDMYRVPRLALIAAFKGFLQRLPRIRCKISAG